MARKISITKEMIKNAAFEITKVEGMDHVTARRLADQAGCSTQPIFRIYESMDQLNEEIFDMATDYFSSYYSDYKQSLQKEGNPFVDFGYAYIQFAMEEPMLFTTLFLTSKRYGKSLYELLNGTTGAFMKEMAKAKTLGVKNPGELFMKMWIFIHGAACMAITGDYDLTQTETMHLLEESYAKNC